ncbi:COG4223 family protein [Pararhizobium antarcticum]|uniref:Phage tail protein n=1 Tax=Pararhizobium antarcticum TaxID=1798805 RepID=A0A657LY05_9HYPH|nr:COG4223 family protein [Pararhizobium antarcticum]OJF89861.1 hypothetical protein AX761_07720 [Rhizobium sp. 58]OJF99810.1 hypothetical protein AX760_12235 [Pararhizobium antarcticum]
MVPDTPPRRSKPDQQSLTIELEANTERPDAAERADLPETPAEEPVVSTAGTEENAASPLPSENMDTPETEARAESAAAAFAEEPTRAEEPVHDRTEPARPPSSAGALAAGILGGLITLLGAGGLQYAGVLPSLAPDTGSNVSQTLAADVEALKVQLAAVPPASETVDLAPLETRLAELEQNTAQAGSGTAADLSGLEASITNLTNELAALKSGLADAQASTETTTTELSSRIEAAEKKIDEPASDVQLARAVAVTALKTAIDRGGPFLAELDALKSIAAEDPAVTGLAGDATTGIASRADMIRDFPSTADAMLEASEFKDPNQGVFSRLIDSASSAIRVRPVGSVEGEGPAAVVARIENKLTNGDFKGASLEWQALPEEAKSAGADFKTKLDQRIRVESLIDAAVAGVMTNQG